MVLHTARQEWRRLEPKRHSYLQRAQDASSLTLPYLFPPTFDAEGRHIAEQTAALSLPTPFQAVGARGLNNVASKFVTGLVPTQPFFNLQIDRFLFEQQFGRELLTDAEQSLVVIENAIMGELDAMHFRPVAFEAFLHLAVSGNGMIEVPDKGPAVFHPLHTYVVERSPEGEVLQILIRVQTSLGLLSKRRRQAALNAKAVTAGSDGHEDMASKPVMIWTWLKRMGPKRWSGVQQFDDGSEVPDTRGAWDEEDFPYIVMRWNQVSGEHYARGLVEQYIGDLRSLEGLMQSIVQASAAAAHHIWLVNPNSPVRVHDIEGAPTGAFRIGNADDITALRLDKNADLAVAQSVADRLEQRLSRAFLMLEGAIRDSERTTGFEVDQVVQELNENLGGVFATQSPEFQFPLVTRIMGRMARRRALPVIPRGVVKPKIITGIEGIGRGAEAARLTRGLGAIRQTLGDAAIETIDRREATQRLLTGLGVQTEGLLLSAEDISQNQNRQTLQSLLESGAGGQLVQQLGQLAQQQQPSAA